jgi:uncharacterized membrane protein
MNKRSESQGQALVETALTLPILILLLLVAIEGGRLVLAKMAAERLARETAEMAGSVGSPTSEVWDYLAGQIAAGGNALGQVQGARLTVYGRTGGERCHRNYPAASGSCQAKYGDWIEVELRVRVSTWFGDVDLGASHRAAAWRAFAP